MVLFLVPDIVTQRGVIRAADRECTVPVLPLELPSMRERLVNPSGGVGFDGANQLGDSDCGWWLNIQMYMVSDSASAQKPATFTIDYGCRAGKQA